MKKEQCKKRERKPAKRVQINIRLSNELSGWLAKEKLSPTAVFHEACKELGYNE